MIEPEDRWEPLAVEVRMTSGPDRIYDDNPAPGWHTPVGFTWRYDDDETEPLLWEGDNA